MVFHITVLQSVQEAPIDLSQVDPSNFRFCGWTTDGLFYRDRWHVLCNREVPLASIPMPCSKVLVGERWMVQDFAGRPIRMATAREQQNLEYHCSFSSEVFAHALEADLGIISDRIPDKIRTEYRCRLAAICSE